MLPLLAPVDTRTFCSGPHLLRNKIRKVLATTPGDTACSVFCLLHWARKPSTRQAQQASIRRFVPQLELSGAGLGQPLPGASHCSRPTGLSSVWLKLGHPYKGALLLAGGRRPECPVPGPPRRSTGGWKGVPLTPSILASLAAFLHLWIRLRCHSAEGHERPPSANKPGRRGRRPLPHRVPEHPPSWGGGSLGEGSTLCSPHWAGLWRVLGLQTGEPRPLPSASHRGCLGRVAPGCWGTLGSRGRRHKPRRMPDGSPGGSGGGRPPETSELHGA